LPRTATAQALTVLYSAAANITAATATATAGAVVPVYVGPRIKLLSRADVDGISRRSTATVTSLPHSEATVERAVLTAAGVT
jgi:ribosomal protein S8E